MERIRIEAVSHPFETPARASHAARILTTADAMGLLEGLSVRSLDMATLQTVVSRLSAAGIGREVEAMLTAGRDEAFDVDRVLQLLGDALEDSAAPDFEWDALVRLFESEELEAMLGVSRVSVQRYRAGDRRTPDDVAARLHFLAMVVGSLAGAYNSFGVRRWFKRPRTQLEGKTPRALLSGDWDPDDDGPRNVRALAEALAGAGAT